MFENGPYANSSFSITWLLPPLKSILIMFLVATSLTTPLSNSSQSHIFKPLSLQIGAFLNRLQLLLLRALRPLFKNTVLVAMTLTLTPTCFLQISIGSTEIYCSSSSSSNNLVVLVGAQVRLHLKCHASHRKALTFETGRQEVG